MVFFFIIAFVCVCSEWNAYKHSNITNYNLTTTTNKCPTIVLVAGGGIFVTNNK